MYQSNRYTRTSTFVKHLQVRSQAQEDVINIDSKTILPKDSTRGKNGKNGKNIAIANKGAERTETLRRYQEKASKVASSYEPSRFSPHPLLRNRHLQTISGVFLRKDPNCAYVTDKSNILSSLLQTFAVATGIHNKGKELSENQNGDFWDARHTVATPDGDFFHVDMKYAGEQEQKPDRENMVDNGDDKFWWRSKKGSEGTVLVLHGLESNSNSTLSTEMADAYISSGFDVAFLNFRGCSGVPNNSLGGYHLGFTEDLLYLLDLITNQECNYAGGKTMKESRWPLYLSGFSLGANVVLKTLGELGESAVRSYNIRGASVTGAPFDQERNIHFVDGAGFNRAVYSANFLRTMKVRAQEQLVRFCDGDVCTVEFDYEAGMKATTIAEFENAFIAKVYDFENNVDYYQKTSCIYFLDGITVPTLIINAGDDPFFDPDYFPWEKGCDFEGRNDNPPIKLVRTEHGGHLGYMFQQVDISDLDKDKKISWMPLELARFLQHVHDFGPLADL